MRNPLFSKKLKRSEARLLIIDDNQIRYNQICEQLKENNHAVVATLLDDVKTFEKQLHLTWDIVIFGRAYDLKVDQAIAIIRSSNQPNLPLLLLKPDDYEPSQYTEYVRKGLYDVVNIDYPERFYYGVIRTLSFSRLQQSQEKLLTELETAQTHAQALVEDSNKAIAIIQEGIHVQANPEYLDLFGFKSEDEIVGTPLLDLLKPQNVAELKTRFKKATQGQFDLGAFAVDSQNKNVVSKNPLNVEFLKATEEDAIQITIDIEPEITNAAQITKEVVVQAPNIFQQINRALNKQPAPANALVLFSLNSCPEQVFQSDWATLKTYFANIKEFLKEQTQVPLFKVDTSVYVGLFQAESQTILDSKLIGLSSLKKPQLLSVNGKSYPLNFRIGYVSLEGNLQDEVSLEKLLSHAFNSNLPAQKCDETTSLELSTEAAPVAPSEPLTTDNIITSYSINPIIQSLENSLNKGEIHLKFQQLYDKEDANLYVYEVTTGFIDGNEWKDCCSITEFSDNSELSIKLDRWILVEACKQLHNFITQYPAAKLVVNLNIDILLNDKAFPEFVAKLITIVGSKSAFPLILQFSANDVLKNIPEANKQFIQLRQHGAEISLRDFGQSEQSITILEKMDINCIALHTDLTKMLDSETTAKELSEKLAAFNEIRQTLVLIRELNDMNSFANAWNVDARYIQGDYFQKKLDQLIDVQDQ